MRILRGLTSRILPCGCVAGVYETYDGTVVTLVDERESTCQTNTHEIGKPIPDLDDGSARVKSSASRRTSATGLKD
jgi:hypothetical protein